MISREYQVQEYTAAITPQQLRIRFAQWIPF